MRGLLGGLLCSCGGDAVIQYISGVSLSAFNVVCDEFDDCVWYVRVEEFFGKWVDVDGIKGF